MGFFGWVKSIFKRKPRPATEQKPFILEPVKQVPEKKDTSNNLSFKGMSEEKKEVPIPTPKEPSPLPKKVKPKYSALAQRIRQQQQKNAIIGKALDTSEKLSTINNIHIKRQEFINSQNVTNNYERLLSGRVLGKDKQLMNDIIDNREAILRHRISAEVIIRDRNGNGKITFQLQGVLIEELTLIKDYVSEGQYIKLGSPNSWREHTWPALRDALLQNNVRGVSEPKINKFADEDGFICGNVEMNVTYA